MINYLNIISLYKIRQQYSEEEKWNSILSTIKKNLALLILMH